MRVDAATSAAVEGGQKQGGTRRWLQVLRLANIFALRRRVFRSGVLEDEEILGLYQLFLDARRSDEDVISAADRCLHRDREYDQRSPSLGAVRK